VDVAKQLAPEDDGQLRESIDVHSQLQRAQKSGSTKFGRRGEADGLAVYIGPNYRRTGKVAAPHAHFPEFGTAPRRHKTTGKFVGQTPATPFLRPAFDSMWRAVVALFAPEAEAELMRAMERARKKAARLQRRTR
jgi:HK97 gp10 family phage protein